jgi:hypothetical protein
MTKPVTIVRADGSRETVMIEDQNASNGRPLHERVMLVYFAIGTISLALTAYVTFMHLKNGK